MAKVVDFLKESYTEMTQKVTWPTWSELQNSAVIVLVASIIIAILVFAMDRSAGFVLEKFYETMT
ncbi:MAG TPA: preprotein translocase subunit SecE [Sphingobacteriaceae bacterium]|nr:preprotein translocase subunit SecE [Sphingobacteriaceae bacterium]